MKIKQDYSRKWSRFVSLAYLKSRIFAFVIHENLVCGVICETWIIWVVKIHRWNASVRLDKFHRWHRYQQWNLPLFTGDFYITGEMHRWDWPNFTSDIDTNGEIGLFSPVTSISPVKCICEIGRISPVKSIPTKKATINSNGFIRKS